MSRRTATVALLLLLALPATRGAAAQEPARDQAAPDTLEQVTAAQVVRRGSYDVAVDRRLARLLEADPLVIVRDTMLLEGDTVGRSVLVLDATVVLEGVVRGDLVLVDAGAFVRPSAEVHGDLVNVAGGLYRSQLARVDGIILNLPLSRYRVVREADRMVIEASASASLVTLDELAGFHKPAYDRVNGLTALWGATLHIPPVGELTPALHGQVGWLTERGEPTWEADLSFKIRGTTLFGGVEEGWATNDDWIRGDLRNSLSYVWNGRDYRDYHDARRTWVGIARALGDEEKRFHGRLSVQGQVEDAASLEGGNPWHLLGDSARANPPVDDGRITSVMGSYEMSWNGERMEFDGGVGYEAAREWRDGAFTFDRVVARADWAMLALANHTLEIDLFAQVPLGGDSLPRQRWSYVGGSGTLQTLQFGEFYGDRVVFVETKYVIPAPPRVALPILGAPELQLIHAAGMAWTATEERDLHQEIGARLQFFGLYVRYMVAPDSDRDPDVDIGVSWPFGGGYPWEKR